MNPLIKALLEIVYQHLLHRRICVDKGVWYQFS